MKFEKSVKPISYFKAHASEIISEICENSTDMVITQNGEARVIVQDVRTYDETQESLALLKILAGSTKRLEEGEYRPASESFASLDESIRGRKES